MTFFKGGTSMDNEYKAFLDLLIINGESEHSLGFAKEGKEIAVGNEIECVIMKISNKKFSLHTKKIIVESLDIFGNIFYIRSGGNFYIIKKCKNETSDNSNDNVHFTISYGTFTNNRISFQIVQMIENCLNCFPLFINGFSTAIIAELNINGLYIACSKDNMYLCLIH